MQIRRLGRARAEVRRDEALLDAQTKKDVKAILEDNFASQRRLPGPQTKLLSSPQGRSVRKEPRLRRDSLGSSSDVMEIAALGARNEAVEKFINLAPFIGWWSKKLNAAKITLRLHINHRLTGLRLGEKALNGLKKKNFGCFGHAYFAEKYWTQDPTPDAQWRLSRSWAMTKR